MAAAAAVMATRGGKGSVGRGPAQSSVARGSASASASGGGGGGASAGAGAIVSVNVSVREREDIFLYACVSGASRGGGDPFFGRPTGVK